MFKNSPASTGNPIHIQNINHKPPKQNNPKFIQPDSNVRHVLRECSDRFWWLSFKQEVNGKNIGPFSLIRIRQLQLAALAHLQSPFSRWIKYSLICMFVAPHPIHDDLNFRLLLFSLMGPNHKGTVSSGQV